MITYPISLPTSPVPSRVVLTSNDTVGMTASPFTGLQNTFEFPGKLWTATVELPPMNRAQAQPWISALMSLKGPRGTFFLGDYLNTSPRGTGGTISVVGAGQTGNELVTDAVAGALLAGDYFTVGGFLHKVMVDNASGTLDIWPDIRQSPADSAVLVLNNTQGIFRRLTNDLAVEQTPGPGGGLYKITFEAIEAIFV